MPIHSQMDPIFRNFHLTKYRLCLWKLAKMLWAQRTVRRFLNLTRLKGIALKSKLRMRILSLRNQWIWIYFQKETSQKSKYFLNVYQVIVWVDKGVQVLPNSNLRLRKTNWECQPKMVHLDKISSTIKCYMNRKREIWRGRQRKAKHSITMGTPSSLFTLLVQGRVANLRTLQVCTPLTSTRLTTSTLTCHLITHHMVSLQAHIQFSHLINHQRKNKWPTRKWCPVWLTSSEWFISTISRRIQGLLMVTCHEWVHPRLKLKCYSRKRNLNLHS